MKLSLEEWKKTEIKTVKKAQDLIGSQNLKSCLLDCYKDHPDKIDSYDMDDISNIGEEIIRGRRDVV